MDKVTLLGVSIDNKLTIKNHIDELCRKASYKLYAMRRIRPFLLKEKPGYLRILLLIASFYMLLYYGRLLVKVQSTKSAKLISEHSKLFIMPMKHPT